MANRWGNNGSSDRLFSWPPKSLQMVTAAMKLRCLLLGRKAVRNLDSILKSRDVTLLTKVHLVKAMVFSSSRVWMWELDHKVGWALKNRCFWTVVLEKTLESPLGCKDIKLVNTKGDQHWIFIGRADAEAAAPIFWPPDVKSWLIGKDPNAGKDWRKEEKRATENEMAGWHHQLNGHGFGWTPGVGDGQGGLACCSSWGRKELDMTEWLNWTELISLYKGGIYTQRHPHRGHHVKRQEIPCYKPRNYQAKREARNCFLPGAFRGAINII